MFQVSDEASKSELSKRKLKSVISLNCQFSFKRPVSSSLPVVSSRLRYRFFLKPSVSSCRNDTLYLMAVLPSKGPPKAKPIFRIPSVPKVNSDNPSKESDGSLDRI